MKRISFDQLKKLASAREPNCVSISMPVHGALPHAKQNMIRLKNNLRLAEARLVQNGVNPNVARERLYRAQIQFEQTPSPILFENSRGFVYLQTATEDFVFHTDDPIPELVVVADAFHVKPLVRDVLSKAKFRLVCLSQEHLHLYEGSRAGLQEMELPPGMPTSVWDFAGTDVGTGYRAHIARPGTEYMSGAHKTAAYAAQDQIDDLQQAYCRRVGSTLSQKFPRDGIPFLLAAAGSYHPVLGDAMGTLELIEPGILVSPDAMRPAELFERAIVCVQDWMDRQDAAARTNLENLIKRGAVTDQLGEILDSALEGRVLSLFTVPDQEMWGRYNEHDRKVSLDATQLPGDRDLFDYAVSATLATGGEIHIVRRDRMPVIDGRQTSICAAFRW